VLDVQTTDSIKASGASIVVVRIAALI